MKVAMTGCGRRPRHDLCQGLGQVQYEHLRQESRLHLHIYTGEVRQIHSMYCVLIENSLRRPNTTTLTLAAV